MEIYLVGVLGVVLAMIIALIFIKDAEVSRRFMRYEKAIESVMQENFNLKKQLGGMIAKESDEDVIGRLEQDLRQKVQADLNEKIVPILKAIKNIEHVIDEFASEQKTRMHSLEERTKGISKLTPSAANEEEQIVRMFNSGKSVESIAKDLRLGVGRVEFVLKLHQLA